MDGQLEEAGGKSFAQAHVYIKEELNIELKVDHAQ